MEDDEDTRQLLAVALGAQGYDVRKAGDAREGLRLLREARFDMKGFRQFMIGTASLLRRHGRSALLTQTVTGGEAAEHTAPYLSTIADTILTLDYSVQDYELKRTLRVIKMRGSAHESHPYRLAIGEGGLAVEKVPPPVDRRAAWR